jgi:multidrug efflux pump subunit AcrA (membrane-fusion protein)
LLRFRCYPIGLNSSDRASSSARSIKKPVLPSSISSASARASSTSLPDYEAFPYQQFGTYSGHVAKVSQTIVTSTDASGPLALKEPAYRVTATLDRPDIDAYGKPILLQPDMLLRADIILEKRSLVSWFLDPLLSVRM